MSQEVEYLPSKCKALSSNPNITKKHFLGKKKNPKSQEEIMIDNKQLINTCLKF
jgi:hypothetical protein